MKRITFIGSAAAGLIAAAIAAPAMAQSTTYPAGTDCSAIQDSANRTDCMHQMNESRQNPAPGSVVDPGNPNPQPGTQPGAPNAPDNRAATPGSSPTNGQGGATGAGGAAGTNGAGTSQ